MFPKAAGLRKAKPVFTMPSWVPGLGFKATIVDIWESEATTDYGEIEVQECLLLKEPKVDEILYHKAIIDAIMNYDAKPMAAKEKVRWIHLPTNNMTWAEMLITSLCNEKNMPVYKSFWGMDPFYTSPDLSPHSRFITPQCGRLIQDGLNPEEDLSKKARKHAPLFMAMPYIHWETDLAQTHVAELIEEVRLDSEKTSGAQENNFWPSEKNRLEPNPAIDLAETQTTTSSADEVNIETQDVKENYRELLRRYLFKRRPLHLRRTLDQYYYSHLADTNFRDSDQVVMRQLNEQKKDLKLQSNPDYQELKKIEGQEQKIAESSLFSRIVQKAWRSRPMRLEEVKNQLFKIEQTLYRDNNSPVLMVDQLWLWVVDEKTVVTCFPRRLQSTRDNEDLDGEDETDVLKTIIAYLHSPRRPEIENSNDLAALIFCQCVSILHRADMISEIDFLKNYSIWSNIWADEVMQMLIQFVKSFENFMVWIKQQPAESEESIRRFEEIFNVTKQTHLLRNIQDLKDELCMLEAVFQDQIEVLSATGKEIDKANFQCVDGCEVDEAVPRCPHSSMAFVDQSNKHWKQITRMQAQANQAYDTLKDLLDLKQQQANVLEARVSRNEAISSGEQSKTIMVFTIVTIIFLPLTFVTTIFALPIAEFKRVVVPASQPMPPTPFLPKSFVEPFIIGVTFAVAIPLIIAAFKIQWAMNTYKLFKLWVSEELKKRREQNRKTKNEHYWPDFLKDNEKVEQDSEMS
ncbi:hypothetical protein N431DRAFT_394088 [Stipitochalara longipes BDJ]|nr:hypothetical protein N431DRAFT_394088 [Stipitochalara longipes BDJ]